MSPAAATAGTAAPDAADLAATRRRLVVRLLLPRGREQVWKWTLIPVGAALALGVRASWPSAGEVAALVLVWLVAEQLGYQARYQLNDLRDRAADAAHPAGAARGRLSFPFTPLRAALVWGSVAVRAVLAVALTALVLDGAPQEAAAWFLVVMVVSSAAYEAARERVRREVVVPGTARAAALGVPVLLVVPVGYGLRVWAGYHALRPEGGPVTPAVLVVAAVLCLFTASTLLAWALEGTSFLRPADGPGGSGPGDGGPGDGGPGDGGPGDGGPGDGGPGVRVDPALGQRAHIALLVAHAGLLERLGPPTGHPAVTDRPAGGRPAPEPVRLVLARDRPAAGARSVLAWDLAAAAAVALAHAVVVAASGARGAAALGLLALGALSAAAPLVARAVRPPGPGPWDRRPSWLGGGALAVTVAVELTVLAVLVAALAAVAPRGLLVVWFVAFVLFQWGATRASSYVRGFGPLSLVRRPLAWLRARR